MYSRRSSSLRQLSWGTSSNCLHLFITGGQLVASITFNGATKQTKSNPGTLKNVGSPPYLIVNQSNCADCDLNPQAACPVQHVLYPCAYCNTQAIKVLGQIRVGRQVLPLPLLLPWLRLRPATLCCPPPHALLPILVYAHPCRKSVDPVWQVAKPGTFARR